MEGVMNQVDLAVNQVKEGWEGIFGPLHELSKNFLFMHPITVPIACIAYLLFVAVVPRILGGKTFNLKPLMRVYNLFMVLLSTYMGTLSLYQAYRGGYSSVWCVPYGAGKLGEEMAFLTWIFTFSKIIEFLDTVFMVFEGRMRQVSFLHVYHHVSIFTYWFAITWAGPGADAYFSLAINSYIHVMMYGYYFLASFGYQPWWKYYLTYMQIMQFISFCGQSIVVGWVKSCEFPQVLARGLLLYMLTLIALFGNFLLQNKFKKKPKIVKKTE